MRYTSGPKGGLIPTQTMAELLHITEDEYRQLKHSEIRTIRDASGSIYNHYIVIEEDNSSEILKKLHMNHLRIIYFSRDAFDFKDFPEDSVF